MKYECIYNVNENVVEAVPHGKGDVTQLLIEIRLFKNRDEAIEWIRAAT